jgi:hypothetical protein
MYATTKTASAALAVLVLASCAGPNGEPNAGQSCDGACLADIADTYLSALIAGDPDAAPLSGRLVFVENLARLPPGEGLWATAAGAGTGFRIVVPDPVEGAVGLMAVIDREQPEGRTAALVAVRLKVERGQIVEAEHLVADVPDVADRAHLAAPRANLAAIVPEPERMTRADIAAIAAAYYDSLVASDSTLAPFASDCERYENGMLAAGPGLAPAPFDSVDIDGRSPPPVARDCIGQLDSRRFAYIDAIDHRRVFAVDPEQGLAMGLSHFRQSMNRGPHRMIAADGSELMWDEQREPYDLPAAHVFRIAGGEIHEVEAIGLFVPYGSPTGWE